MKQFTSESDFQNWVQGRFMRIGHVQDHRFHAQPSVPDVSAAVGMHDYWLELKWGQFRLGHDKYDRFEFPSQRISGQLEWLKRRQMSGSATCGILAYFHTGLVSYVFFMLADEYWAKVYKQEIDVGAMILGNHVVNFDRLCEDPDPMALVHFIEAAARDRPWSPRCGRRTGSSR